MNEVGFSDEFAALISPIVVDHDLDLFPLAQRFGGTRRNTYWETMKKEIHMKENRPKIRIVQIEMEAI